MWALGSSGRRDFVGWGETGSHQAGETGLDSGMDGVREGGNALKHVIAAIHRSELEFSLLLYNFIGFRNGGMGEWGGTKFTPNAVQ